MIGRARFTFALVSSSLVAGCSLYSPTSSLPESTAHAPTSGLGAKTTPPDESSVRVAGANPSVPSATGSKSPDPKALAAVLAEIQEVGELDREMQTQLLKDLQNTDPAMWPQMVNVCRASLAFRNQLAQREQKSTGTAEGDSPKASFKNASAVVASESVSRGTASKSVHSGLSQPNSDRRAIAEMEQVPIGGAFSTTPADSPDGNYPRTCTPEAVAVEEVASPQLRSSRTKNSTPPDRALDPNVIQTSYEKPVHRAAEHSGPSRVKDWKGQIGLAIQSLEADSDKLTGEEEISRQAALRLLYLVAGRRDDSLKPIPGLPTAQQDFWSKELFGMNAMLDVQRTGDVGRRAAEANLHLREASGRLAELAPLQVRNLNFCTEVISFGVFKKFEKNEFKPGQEVLLYAEIDNFVTESTSRGFHTAFKTRYQIHDSRGNRVDEIEFPLTEEYCQNARRDFFVRYLFNLPKQIFNGPYTLQLSIEDLTGRKIGQASIDFVVKEK